MNHNRLKLFNFKWSSILRFKKNKHADIPLKYTISVIMIDPSSEKMEFYS